MKLNFAILVLATSYLSGCSSPTPSIDLEQLAGVYRSPPCPPIQISSKLLSYDGERSSFELIRIKNHDVMETATTPRFVVGRTCKLVTDFQSSYMQIDQVDGHFAFDVYSTDRTEVMRFIREE
jgi:hypothetical protein